MPRLPIVTARQTVAALGRLGFEPVRQTGGHLHLRNGNLLVTVPMHPGDLSLYVLRSILRQARLSVAEFKAALR